MMCNTSHGVLKHSLNHGDVFLRDPTKTGKEEQKITAKCIFIPL